VSSLPEILTDPALRPQAVEALAGVVEAEVQGSSGIGGVALKAAYRAVTRISPNLVLRAVDYMLPDVAEQLEPFWAARQGHSFGTYLTGRSDEAADALLSVTDRRAAKPDHAALATIYRGVRGRAKTQVAQALPRLGDTIEFLTK